MSPVEPNQVNPESSVNPLLVGQKRASELLGVSPRMVGYLIANGDLATCRIGRRTLVRCSSLTAFVRRDHPSPTKASGGAR
jgi:hypothetical protein